MPEVAFNRDLFVRLFIVESTSYDIVFALDGEAVSDIILFLKHVSLLHELNAFLSIDVVITLLNVHGDEVQFLHASLFPALSE